jgi:hypothetical protein
MYNLNYAPTTLGVQSWVEKCLLGVRGGKKVEYHWCRGHTQFLDISGFTSSEFRGVRLGNCCSRPDPVRYHRALLLVSENGAPYWVVTNVRIMCRDAYQLTWRSNQVTHCDGDSLNTVSCWCPQSRELHDNGSNPGKDMGISNFATMFRRRWGPLCLL